MSSTRQLPLPEASPGDPALDRPNATCGVSPQQSGDRVRFGRLGAEQVEHVFVGQDGPSAQGAVAGNVVLPVIHPLHR